MNEAELLFTHLLECDRLSLCRNRNQALSPKQARFVSAALRRRMRAEPLQYIIGQADFFGLSFYVSKDVLIPRPETEILVEKAISIVRQWPGFARVPRMLDLGTGSGCIAVALAKHLPQARIAASDISKSALVVARRNIAFHKVGVSVFQSDLFAGITEQNFDMIIANPPYVATAEIAQCQPEVQHEPVCALDGGRDGLDFYHRIIREAPLYLADDGYLLLEIGVGQEKNILELLCDQKFLSPQELIKDYNGIYRIVIARKVRTHG